MGNLCHCALTISCRLSPPSGRSLQSVLDFFHSLEGLRTFGTSHLTGGLKTPIYSGGLTTRHPFGGSSYLGLGPLQHLGGSNPLLLKALFHLAGSSYLWLGPLTHLGWSYYLWFETLIHLAQSSYLWLGPLTHGGSCYLRLETLIPLAGSSYLWLGSLPKLGGSYSLQGRPHILRGTSCMSIILYLLLLLVLGFWCLNPGRREKELASAGQLVLETNF